jgi:hypothetical protein
MGALQELFWSGKELSAAGKELSKFRKEPFQWRKEWGPGRKPRLYPTANCRGLLGG